MSEWNRFHPDSSRALTWAQVWDILFILSNGVTLPSGSDDMQGADI